MFTKADDVIAAPKTLDTLTPTMHPLTIWHLLYVHIIIVDWRINMTWGWLLNELWKWGRFIRIFYHKTDPSPPSTPSNSHTEWMYLYPWWIYIFPKGVVTHSHWILEEWDCVGGWKAIRATRRQIIIVVVCRKDGDSARPTRGKFMARRHREIGKESLASPLHFVPSLRRMFLLRRYFCDTAI